MRIIKNLSFKLLFKRRDDDDCSAESSPATFSVFDDDDKSYGPK